MDVKVGLNGLIDSIQEAQKLLVTMARLALSDYGSFQHAQRGEQRCGSMPRVVVRLSLGQTGAQGGTG